MPKNGRNSLGKVKQFILIIMIVVPVIPVIVILAIGYFYFSTSLTSTSRATMHRIVEDHGQMIEAFLTERKGDLKYILSASDYAALSRPDRLDVIYNHLVDKSTAFADLGVFDSSGLHIAYHGPHSLAGKIYKDTEWFQEAMEKGEFISDVFLGYRNIPHFIIAVSAEKDHRKLVLRATIDTVTFRNLVNNVHIGKTGEAYILNKAGILQTQRRSGGDLMTPDPDAPVPPVYHDAIHIYLGRNHLGHTYLYATKWIMDGKWQLVVRQEKGEVFNALVTTAYLIIIAAILGGAILVATAVYLAGKVVHRIEDAEVRKDNLEIQLNRAGRLAELGEMAAGFAHEINNPLQIIKSEQALIETIIEEIKAPRQVGRSEHESNSVDITPHDSQIVEQSENAENLSQNLVELEDSVRQISLQVERCSDITHSILKFSRKQEPVIKPIDLSAFIPEIVRMIQKKAQVQGIVMEVCIADNIPPLQCDPSQLQQVLLNLLNNAIDAIQIRHGLMGGRLHIEAEVMDNRRVRIKVADNGCGIEDKNLQKIFTPFFSTKPVGQGTGLGLSICFGIISSMGGKLSFESETGVGSTFFITFPISNK